MLHLPVNKIFSGYLIDGDVDKVTKLISNRWNAESYSYVHSDINAIYVSVNGQTMSLYNPDLTTNEQWKEWFNNNPSVLHGVLANPTDKEITDETLIAQLNEIEKTAHSYGDTTHIFSTDEISLIFDVEACKDQQTENDKLQAQIDELKTSIVALGGV